MEQAIVKELQGMLDAVKWNREIGCEEIAEDITKDFFTNLKFAEKITGKHITVAHWEVAIEG